MTNINDQINLLHARLDALSGKQADISQQINHLRMEIMRLQVIQPEKEEEKTASTIAETGDKANEEKKAEVFQTVQSQPSVSRPMETSASRVKDTLKGKSDLEKFIGENLINKIGIVITVIGVAIGAKYSIDHDLISPLTRIILGYLFGAGLLGFGMKLKSRYENFSAVLVSGAMAILYFITYAAYDFYQLIPQIVTFALLVAFTAFTVVAAIQYNRQVIAHIGLVGAYAVPFLLSDGSGKLAVLFSYMAIINIGILIISFKKYWKPLYYSSFALTWLIYFSWYVNQYRESEHFALAMAYLSVFFILFYTSFLAYKLLRKEQFAKDDILLLLANSFIFFGIGYALLDNESSGQLLGLFTLGNAIVHFIVGILIYRQKLADRNLFYFVAGLVLLFITIAAPVQLDGNWVTLLWAGEAALLFWIGRTRKVAVYEKLAYPLMVLALFSMMHDWASLYGNYIVENPETRIMPLLNINFLTSLLFIASFGFINVLHRDKKYAPSFSMSNNIFRIVPWMLPAILLFAIYYAFRVEIANYYGQLIKDSELIIPTGVDQNVEYRWNLDLAKFRTIWIINYSLLFFSVLTFVNIKRFKDDKLAAFNLVLTVITILVFLIQGLYELSELRESYLNQTNADYYRIGAFNLGIRYVSYVFVGLTLFACHQIMRGRQLVQQDLTMAFDLLLHTTLLWILSSELISIMDISGFDESYKLGLSILWGSYSLMLIGLGIWKKKKHLRIGAIGLFAVTLVKLFVYDISHLDTISKTVVFVSLGILLLVISFLYNKYKNIISNEIKV